MQTEKLPWYSTLNLKLAIDLTGWLAFTFTHLFALSTISGFHYDEAWAANTAADLTTPWKIFTLQAMSPYTALWGHALANLFFKLFSPSVLIFRLSGVALCFAGAFLLSRALILIGKREAARILPWILALFTPLVINHRFCIDLTTLHVFCLGLLFYGAALFHTQPQKRILPTLLILSSILIGITGHVLFIAPVLGLLFIFAFTQTQLTLIQRLVIASVSIGLLPYLIRILIQVPEKDKAGALLFLDGLILVWILFFKGRSDLPLKIKKQILTGVSFLCLPGFFFLFFFSEGHWSVLFTQGWIAHPSFFVLTVPSTVLLFCMLGFSRFKSQTPLDQKLNLGFLMTLFILEVILLKPAPRYFEIAFLMLTVFLALEWERPRSKFYPPVLIFFLMSQLIQLSGNYFETGLDHQSVDRPFHFLFLRDRSTDSVSKQELVDVLGEQGCSFADVQSHNSRLMEVLRFYQRDDWTFSPERSCTEIAPVKVELLSQLPVSELGDPHWIKIENFAIQFTPKELSQ